MRIAINGWFLGQDGAGMGQYLHHILPALLARRDCPDLYLVAPAGRHAPQADAYRAAGLHVVEQPLPPLPRNLAKLWWEQVTMPRAARRLGADLHWAPYWTAPWWQPTPVVVTIHDLIPLLLPLYRGGLLQRGYTHLVRMTARRAAAVITVSQASKRDIVTHLGIPAEHVFAIHHGPNQEEASVITPADRARVRRTYNLPDRFFLYLGGFDARKNVATTLRGYARYLERGGDPAVKLVVAGQLPQEESDFRPDPQRIAAELALGEQVQFCGFIAETDKPAIYSLATAYLFPSTYEGFGMMVLEAMQAGAPVVTSVR